jgi:hypothetical protein
VAVLSLALVQGECSGGGGSRNGQGAVAVFITDLPSDDFDRILVTIECLELIGDDGHVTIFKGRETIDLKDLENFSDLFVYANKIPIGFYHKIRMCVTKLQLVRDGTPPEVIDVRPPAGGKIDLLAKDAFLVVKGITLVIELDMDANKSIHYVATGNGKYQFRPVVFVEVRETRVPAKLARVHGEIVKIIDDRTFELCSTVFMASRDVPDSSDGDEDDAGGLGDRHRCLVVELDSDTSIFDLNGDPAEVDDLMVEDAVTVIGRFHLVDGNHDDPVAMPLNSDGSPASDDQHREHRDGSGGSDDDSDRSPPDIVFLAYVIEIGPPGTFLTLRGTIASEVDGDEFAFDVASEQDLGDESVVTALLQTGTRIFSRIGVELDESRIVPDTRAMIDGVFGTVAAETLYKTALLMLDLRPDLGDVLRGEIVDLDDEQRTMRLAVELDGDVVEECVVVPVEADIFIISEYDDVATRTEGSFEDLRVGWRSAAHGVSEDDFGCLVATLVIAFPRPIECATSADCADADFCSKDSCDGIGLCELRPDLCPLDSGIVCGCDGVTYADECLANQSGTSVASEGACDTASNICTADGLPGCSAGELCLIETGRCDSSAMGFCVREPLECPDDRKPVCGCDGTTYRNACVAAKAGVVVEDAGACACGGEQQVGCSDGDVCRIERGMCEQLAEGVCVEGPASCPTDVDLVCGCDGNTYDNACLALQMEVTVEFTGACGSGNLCGGANPACAAGEICRIEAGLCSTLAEGTCVPEPWNCPDIEPVCGCDGKTYLSACEAAVEGVTVAFEGACALCGGDGEARLECRDGEVCLVEPGVCDELAEGFCIDRPKECSTDGAPVCGCDGETYPNPCSVLAAGVSIDSAGECPPGS